MGDTRTQHLHVRMSGQVIAPDDLDQRMQVTMRQLGGSGASQVSIQTDRHPSAVESAGSHSDRLGHAWTSTDLPVLQRHPGARGRVVHLVKRTVRRLSSWYVEPMRAAQRHFNTETLLFTVDATDALRTLQREVENLQLTNERLLRRLHATEQAISMSAVEPDPAAPRRR